MDSKHNSSQPVQHDAISTTDTHQLSIEQLALLPPSSIGGMSGELSMGDEECEIDDEEEYETPSDVVYEQVMGYLRKSLLDAGVSKDRILSHEDLVENSLAFFLDLVFYGPG